MLETCAIITGFQVHNALSYGTDALSAAEVGHQVSTDSIVQDFFLLLISGGKGANAAVSAVLFGSAITVVVEALFGTN